MRTWAFVCAVWRGLRGLHRHKRSGPSAPCAGRLETTCNFAAALPFMRPYLTAHSIEDDAWHLCPAGVFFHCHNLGQHLMSSAVTCEVRGLGECTERRAQYRFLDAFQHGSVMDEAAAALNILRSRPRIRAPRRCSKCEWHADEGVDGDNSVTQLCNRSLHCLVDAWVLERMRMHNEVGIERTPQFGVAKFHCPLQILHWISAAHACLRDHRAEWLLSVKRFIDRVRIKSGDEDPRQCPGYRVA